MNVNWGYSPKKVRYIPLGDFPADRYLVIAWYALLQRGWDIGFASPTRLLAYTPLSWASYSEEISIHLEENFAIVKSECLGIQLLFNDYGKNSANLEAFFHEFEYAEFHLKDQWEEMLGAYSELTTHFDPNYLVQAPLVAKEKIRHVFHLLLPQRGYLITPWLLWLNVFFFLGRCLFIFFFYRNWTAAGGEETVRSVYDYLGGNNRELVLGGEWWRLATSFFTHGSFQHFFFNMYALTYIGLMIEPKLGPQRTLFIYSMGGITAALVSLIIHEHAFMVGASGAIMSLFGAFFALLFLRFYEPHATKALLISTGLVILLMLFTGMNARVDNAAHLGGLISGLVYAVWLCRPLLPGKRGSSLQRYAGIMGGVLLFGLVTWKWIPHYQFMAYEQLERTYVDNFRKLGVLYRIPSELSQEEKLKLIQENGIRPGKENKQLIGQMKKLRLNATYEERVHYHERITAKVLLLTDLLYREAKEGHVGYRREMQGLINDINRIRMEPRLPPQER